MNNRQHNEKHILKCAQMIQANLRTCIEECYEKLADSKYTVRITQSLRTFDEQAQLYSQGRTKPGKKVTWVKAGYSYHNYGLAVDFCLYDKATGQVSWDTKYDHNSDGVSDWQDVVEVFESYGWHWGGRWTKTPDRCHFEWNVETIKELYAKHSTSLNTKSKLS